MAHLNHMGPEEKGPKTGRKLGLCRKKTDEISEFEHGKGMGRRRHGSGLRRNGQGLRKHANEI